MCDTFVRVLSDRVLFAKNSDREADEPQVIEWHDARTHAPGERLRCTWMSIPEVARTHAILISRPIGMWGAEIGTNEHGVTIGNEAVFTKENVPKEGGLTGMDLVRLALSRSTNAREAVHVIASLHERHGQGGRCGYEDASFRYFSSFIVADARDAWVVETAGSAWAEEKVIGARSISNALTIPGFAETHSDIFKTRIARGRSRQACTTSAASRARTPADLARALRDHGGRAWPRYSPISGAMDSVCMHAGGLLVSSQTTSSWIAELSSSSRHFVTATSAPCTSIFKPVSVSERIDLPVPARHPDASLWWTHERLHRAVMRDPETLAPLYTSERDAMERRFLSGEVPAARAWQEARVALDEWIRRIEARVVRDTRPFFARRHWRALKSETDGRRRAAH
jgi:dipeptidase